MTLAFNQTMMFNTCFSPSRLFGFVARKQGSTTDNVSHLFAELDPGQPAAAITSFVSRTMKRWNVDRQLAMLRSSLASFFARTRLPPLCFFLFPLGLFLFSFSFFLPFPLLSCWFDGDGANRSSRTCVVEPCTWRTWRPLQGKVAQGATLSSVEEHRR